MTGIPSRFRLDGRVIIITGGAGLLGIQHAQAVAEAGGTPVLWDLHAAAAEAAAVKVAEAWGVPCHGLAVDITSEQSVTAGLAATLAKAGAVHGLINNAANNPQVKPGTSQTWSRLENFPLEMWGNDIAVGLTGAFLCARVVGAHLAANGGGVILNIASDLGVIAPDQRIYRKPGLADHEQPVKPVTYSVVKHGLIGLTKYLATYWADAGVRANSLCPGGVYVDQPDDFVGRLTNLIPMGRMARADEYRGAVQFLCSDASSYMTGACVNIDGGRTVW